MKIHTSKQLEALLTPPPRLGRTICIDCDGYDQRATHSTVCKLIKRRGWNMTTRAVDGDVWVWQLKG